MTRLRRGHNAKRPTSNAQHRMKDGHVVLIRRSMFDVQCSMFSASTPLHYFFVKKQRSGCVPVAPTVAVRK